MLKHRNGLFHCSRAHQRNGLSFRGRHPTVSCCSSGNNAEIKHVAEDRGPASICIDDRKQQVTLSVLLRLAEQGTEQLDSFLKSRPEPTSIGFLSWLSDQVSSNEGTLEPLIEYLVLWRERREEERLDELYHSTLESILDDVSNSQDKDMMANALVQNDRERMRELLTSNPELLSAAVAEKVTGEVCISSGMFEDPVHELILQTSPFPASLSPEGVRISHAAAAELASDLSSRRKRSVTSMIGRAKLTSEQADALMAGTAASRILKMILFLPTQEEMISCLPDCFTPPDAGQCSEDVGDTEELWCTPAQLLSEIEVQIRSLKSEGEPRPLTDRLLTVPSNSTVSLQLLEELRQSIKEQWIAKL